MGVGSNRAAGLAPDTGRPVPHPVAGAHSKPLEAWFPSAVPEPLSGSFLVWATVALDLFLAAGRASIPPDAALFRAALITDAGRPTKAAPPPAPGRPHRISSRGRASSSRRLVGSPADVAYGRPPRQDGRRPSPQEGASPLWVDSTAKRWCFSTPACTSAQGEEMRLRVDQMAEAACVHSIISSTQSKLML